ncbi:MAG: hypothetical protein K1X88_15910 [Nannocystaceae bacterium]|nr:hypothetical protein [Nannocystaceae bacterium]
MGRRGRAPGLAMQDDDEVAVRLRPGDEVRLQCDFDSTDRDTNTTWGEGSGDEMCAVVFFARPAQ